MSHADLNSGEEGTADGDMPDLTYNLHYLEAGGGELERVDQECFSIPDVSVAHEPAGKVMSSAAAGSSLREPCHDVTEPTAAIGWLSPAADAVQLHRQMHRLRARNQKHAALALGNRINAN